MFILKLPYYVNPYVVCYYVVYCYNIDDDYDCFCCCVFVYLFYLSYWIVVLFLLFNVEYELSYLSSSIIIVVLFVIVS